jgi:hypothetical protein
VAELGKVEWRSMTKVEDLLNWDASRESRSARREVGEREL